MSGIQRVTISIPSALRDRMEAVKGQVNWSAVAARAFDAKLLELELAAKRGHMQKQDIVKRLKATKDNDTEDYEDGKAAGQQWAAEEATAKELERIARYIRRMEAGQGSSHVAWWHVGAPQWRVSPTHEFAYAAQPKYKDDPSAADDFWQAALGDDAERIEDPDFFHGFGDGVVEVWNEVQADL
jgi:hypothetical protein